VCKTFHIFAERNSAGNPLAGAHFNEEVNG